MEETKISLNLRDTSATTVGTKQEKTLSDSRAGFSIERIKRPHIYFDLDPNRSLKELLPFFKSKEKIDHTESDSKMFNTYEGKKNIEYVLGMIIEIADGEVVLEIEKDGSKDLRTVSIDAIKQITKSAINPGDLINFVNVSDEISSFTTMVYVGKGVYKLDPERIKNLEEKFRKAITKR